MKGVVTVVSLTAVLLFAGTAMAQTKVVVVPLGGKKAAGDAVAAEVLEGKTFSNTDEVGIDGAMVNNGAITLTPGSADQTVSEGYHDGTGTVAGDANLAPGNIKTGATIFGVTGTTIEASGTAAPAQVLSGQTFSNASGPASGSMPNIVAQNITPGTAEHTITQGYHNGSGRVAGDGDLVSGNIKTGATIFGVAGDPNVVDTSTGDALAGDLRSGKKAWVDGSEVTGAMPAQTWSNTTTAVAAGYYDAADLVTVDTDLLARNICLGVTIFGITGTGPWCFQEVTSSTGQVWMDSNLGASQVATSLTDTEAYGDLYQWGRVADGHQRRTSPTTLTLSSTDVPGHGSFIRSSASPNDWLIPQNSSLWQGVSGTNNPCPAGFRLPTAAEWETEQASWFTNDAAGAFASPLKLVLAGFRNAGGVLSSAGSGGLYWSSTVDGSNSRLLYFDSGSAFMSTNYRADALSVRCLQD